MKSSIVLLTLAAAAMVGPAAAGPVVSVNAVTRTAKAESPIQVVGVPISRGTELRFSFVNGGYGPVTASLKVSGLTSDKYDCYADGSFKGSFSKEQVAQGIPVPMEGGVLDAHARNTLTALSVSLQEAITTMSSDPNSWRLLSFFRNEADRVPGILADDRNIRGVRVTLIESGLSPQTTIFSEKVAPEIMRARWHAEQENIDQLRAIIAADNESAAQKAQEQGWLTPLEVRLFQPPAGGPGALKVAITNYFDKAVAGTIKLQGPAGLTVSPPSCQYRLQPDKEQTCEFALSGPEGHHAQISVVVEGKAGSYSYQRTVRPNVPNPIYSSGGHD